MFLEFQEFFWLVYGGIVQITWMATIAILTIMIVVASIDIGSSQILFMKGGDQGT